MEHHAERWSLRRLPSLAAISTRPAAPPGKVPVDRVSLGVLGPRNAAERCSRLSGERRRERGKNKEGRRRGTERVSSRTGVLTVDSHFVMSSLSWSARRHSARTSGGCSCRKTWTRRHGRVWRGRETRLCPIPVASSLTGERNERRAVPPAGSRPFRSGRAPYRGAPTPW